MRILPRFFLITLTCVLMPSLYAASTKDVNRREIGNLVLENIPEIPTSLKDRLTQFENVRSASVQGWLPADQGLLISTRFAEASQLHTVRGPLQYRKQITFFEEPIGGAAVNPVKPEFLYLKDQGGNENSQIYLYDLESGRSRLLTDGKSRHDNARWDHQGKLFAFSSSMRNGRDTDIYVQDLSQPESKAELLVQEGGSWSPVDFSHDGQKLLVMRNVSANENYLSILDLKSKKLEPLFAGQAPFAFSAALFSRNDEQIYMAMDSQSEFKTLYSYKLANKSLIPITGSIKWDVESLDISPDGKTLVFLVNEGGFGKLYSLDTKSLAYKELKGLPTGLPSGVHFHPKKSNLISLTLSSATNPGDVYTYDLKSGQLQAWTESEIGGLSKETFVEPQLISYKTFDQFEGQTRMIPAFIYKPKDVKAKIPVVISIHGGPEAQFRPTFSSSFQYFATDLGVAVIAPNVRGSSGYGKTYLTLDNGFKREDSVKDIGSLLDWIATQPDLDASKVVVMGGSYGGYMTLASLTFYSDRLAGGVNTVGISHFISFLTNTKSYRQDLRRVEYGDERDPEMKDFLQKISPLTNVAKIKKPLLVVQGLNDPRVPVTEAEQIVKAVRANGNEGWYLLAKDEGHGFRKKVNQSVNLQTNVLFLEKVLFPKKTSLNP